MRQIKFSYKFISTILTIGVILTLILLGPAQAFTLSIISDKPVVVSGEEVSFIASLNINSGERLPLDYLEVTIGPILCKFAPNGDKISGCDDLQIVKLLDADSTNGNLQGEFQGTNYNFGYGYGYGSNSAQILKYNITLDSSTLSPNVYNVQLNAKMTGTPVLFLGDQTTLTINSPGFQIFIDKPQTSVYESNRIPFKLTTTENSKEIVYINHDENIPRETKLCRNCDSFGVNREKNIVLKEGRNELEFIARSLSGEVSRKFVTVFIDNKAPRILKVSPTSGFTLGDFHIEFSELNPVKLLLHYGNAQTGMRVEEVNITDKCTFDRVYDCDFNVNLTDYDQQDITYYFELLDISGKTDRNKSNTLKIDLTPPNVTDINFIVNGNRVTFDIAIDEPNFKELTYLDSNEQIPKEHRLCYNLVSGHCIETDSFGQGAHNIDYIVKDLAENSATGSFSFFTDSVSPRIIRTLPNHGQATGEFYVKFREANPSSLILNYGNTATGQRSQLVNLSSCTTSNLDSECTLNINLTDYSGQEITYNFELTDTSSQMVQSNSIILSV